MNAIESMRESFTSLKTLDDVIDHMIKMSDELRTSSIEDAEFYADFTKFIAEEL
jgi:hypothetical protein